MLSPGDYRACCSILRAGRPGDPEAVRDALFRDLYGLLREHVLPEDRPEALHMLYEAREKPLFDFVKELSRCGWNDSAALSAA